MKFEGDVWGSHWTAFNNYTYSAFKISSKNICLGDDLKSNIFHSVASPSPSIICQLMVMIPFSLWFDRRLNKIIHAKYLDQSEYSVNSSFHYELQYPFNPEIP